VTKLPDDWIINRLEDLCEPGKQAIVDGPFGSNLKRSDYVDSGVPVLKIQNIKENVITLKKMDYVNPEKYQELARHSFTEGDIVMTKLGDPLGVSAIVNGIPNGLIVADLVRIRPSKVLTKFLCYQLNSPRIQKYINEQQKGTTRPRVNLAMIRELPIYTPPNNEQHKILELLEDHLSRLDTALADVKQAKMKATQFRRSLLQAAFTGNLNYDGASLFAEWQTKTIGEIADTQLGKMLNKGKQTGENTVPYLRSVNVQWGRVDTSDLNQMDILPSELAKFTVKKGDLLICEGGESGRVAIWDREEPIGFQNALHRVRAKSEVTNKYLYYYFEWLVKNQLIEHLFNGVTIKHFPQENLRSVEVSYPAIDEQRVIVELLEDHLSRLEISVSISNAMEKQSNGLRRSLLQAAFTGQLTKEEVSV
jgi:type I restriction enzyme S subunit